MFLFYIILEIYIITIINFSVNCLPSATFDNNNRRYGRGFFVPEPKSLENQPLIEKDTTEYTDKPINTTGIFTVKRKKKWQVGRVSRKQYEIVNMIWRKTKVFLDTDATTTFTTNRHSSIINPTTSNNDFKPYLTKRAIKKNSKIFNRNKPTESYIEFYYLDEIDSPRIDENNDSSILNAEYLSNRPQISTRRSKKNKSFKTNSPFLAFHVNISPQTKPSVASTTAPYRISSSFRDHIKRLTFPFLYHNKQHTSGNTLNSTSIKRRRSKSRVNLEDYKGETCPLTTQSITEGVTITNIPNIGTVIDSNELATTFYDRIKFFEIYDRQTENGLDLFSDTYQNNLSTNNSDNSHQDDKNVEKILLEHVDVNSGRDGGIHMYKAKKHVNKNEYTSKEKENKKDEGRKASIKSSPPSVDVYSARIKLNATTKRTESRESKTEIENSKVASWSQYPFAAVYVYEPSQILCDAAAISQHWFITSGSCLSRQHRFEPSTEGRSAFVSYCGGTWRHPERIAYVKYTLVHPKFNPHEISRRFLYNIGVIQVVCNLMNACPGWAPITLMGHQFTTHPGGDMAAAIGWGLDRYAAKYPDTDTPTHPLMEYHALVYSDNCPGNIGYNEAKLVEPLHVIKNVYCLSLPPYNNEESDPVHGSLLLIGGKLLGLYLQEERRGWGEQSAQYTGVWRLSPWILEVAREPEDIDTFPTDI